MTSCRARPKPAAASRSGTGGGTDLVCWSLFLRRTGVHFGGKCSGALSLPALFERVAFRPEILEPRVGIDAAHDCAQLRRGLVEARAPRAEARDHGDVEIQHRKIVAQDVAAGVDLLIHPPPAFGDPVVDTV